MKNIFGVRGFKRKLCPHCKTGKRTYELDRRSPECPYMHCHDGEKCIMYEKLDKGKAQNIFGRIAEKTFMKSLRNKKNAEKLR